MKMNKIINSLAVLMLVILFTVSCSCKHDYQNGACVDCGAIDSSYVAPCDHKYQSGVCVTCGAVDQNYVPPCTHFFFNGACVKCSEPCQHSYVEGICTVCQYEDPDFIPSDGGKSMYDDIVTRFKNLVLYKYVNQELPAKGSNEPFYVDALYDVVGYYDPSLNFGYAYKDVNNDGYVELLLVENSNRMYAMFTIKDKSVALVTTFQNGMGYLGNDGMVFFNTKRFDASEGQIYLGNHMTHLVDGELVGITYGWEDADGNFDTADDEIYYIIDENGVEREIEYEEYKTLRKAYEYYWSYPTRLTKLNDLRFQTALTETYLTDITADFSTYESIVNTLNLIYTEVGNGKLERSKWTSGQYDLGMHFASDEDFVIYNKLIGACVLVQNNSRFTLGYAKSDINGDGTDELVILDDKYCVLAIFTTVDGGVRLLDSFSDLRKAFIDENGLVHVSEKIIPGVDGDYEYSVYEIESGAIVTKLCIGIKSDGDHVKKYKVVDGNTTEIEESEWDTLYLEYSAGIGTDTFESYTKENSGLVFVAIVEK